MSYQNLGWIKLHRAIIDSKTFANPDLFKLWVLCLLKANHTTAWVEIEGLVDPIKVNPGQFVTGRYSLHREYYQNRSNGKSEITIWRWLQKLEEWGNLNIKSKTKYSLVTIKNWDKYQHVSKNDQQHEQRMDINLTPNDRRMNTNKNHKNVKNEKRERAPTQSDFEKIFIKYNSTKIEAARCYNYYKARGFRVGNTPVVDFEALIKSWLSKVNSFETQNNRQLIPNAAAYK